LGRGRGWIDRVWGAGTGLNGALAIEDLQAGFRSDVISGRARQRQKSPWAREAVLIRREWVAWSLRASG
jgi:hypothetical protein